MKNYFLPMHLQYFAEGDGPEGKQDPAPAAAAQQNPAPATQQPQIDYEKLAQIVAGKQSATEDSVLKGYFKQQGLSQEEMAQAIQTFKAQKAASQPDVGALQKQAETAQAEAQKAQIEKEAVLEAVQLGLDAKTIPYILKLADMKGVIGQDGKVSSEALKNAINKVLEDVPQLKPVQETQKGFQIGSSGQQAPGTDSEALKKAFGL